MSLLRVGILSVAEVAGDFALKSYASTGLLKHLLTGIIGYACVIWTLIWSFQTGNVMLINGLWDGMSAVIESVAAYYFLRDRLDNAYQYAGLLMIIAGIFFLKTT